MVEKVIVELEGYGYQFWPIGNELHYELANGGIPPVDRTRQLLSHLKNDKKTAIRYLRTRDIPAPRWIHPQVLTFVRNWPADMFPITLYRQGQPIIFDTLYDVICAVCPCTAWTEDNYYAVSFPYDARIVEEVKALQSRKYDGRRKVWLVDKKNKVNLSGIMMDFFGVSLEEMLGERVK